MLYKVLDADLKSGHGGNFDWTDWLGKPVPTVRHVCLFFRGYHVVANPMDTPLIGMRVFEVVATGDGEYDAYEKKGVYETITLGRERPDLVPDWWHDVERFIWSLPSLPLLRGNGEADPSWRVFETYEEARKCGGTKDEDILHQYPQEQVLLLEVARATGRIGAWSMARRAAEKAALALIQSSETPEILMLLSGITHSIITKAISLALTGAHFKVYQVFTKYRFKRTLAVIRRRWDVWQRGYGLYSDVGGVFYVYRRV